MKKTNHKLVGLALLYLSTTFTFSGNMPVYAGTVENLPIEGSVALNQNAILTRKQLVNREFDNLIRYEVHQSQIWLIFFVKS